MKNSDDKQRKCPVCESRLTDEHPHIDVDVLARAIVGLFRPPRKKPSGPADVSQD